MPKIRIREKDKTTNPSNSSSDNVVFLTDSGAGETPELISSATTKEYKNKNFINEIIRLGGKAIVCASYTLATKYLKDRNQFDIKFLLAKEDVTEGEESPVSELSSALDIAVARRDCVVVYTKTSSSYSSEELSALKATLSESTESDFLKEEIKDVCGKYVLPFYAKSLKVVDEDAKESLKITEDAGHAYILAYLNSAKTNAEWLAVAGSKRGLIPEAKECGFITEDEIDSMQPDGKTAAEIAINPIVDMNPWGIRIWGNRTGYPAQEDDNGLVASSFANIRILICDLKKALYKAARKYQFEQNSDILWVNFQSEVNTLLEEMVQSYGIAGYRWYREDTNERAKIVARLQIVPIEAIEDFDLTIELTDSLSVSE